ncbi:ATP-binding protein [Sphingobacterium sp. lm-10]|uniref:CheR family methyltransferase n=1 Tax=Sphingobacterium sp. lm-10 TaxID=2944904 RepID=UPI002021E329|nr:CheR family methyltransferase [Sphingobacterium sp. lm-10]MCL7987607.1 ATP-binding protein [Sphingobacterium sp. lm-10]
MALKKNKNQSGVNDQFPIIGVGASAGGLEAIKAMLSTIPAHSGMAFIIVQHLFPEKTSLLPDILQKITKIPVVSITEHLHIEPDHIYVIPPGKIVTVANGLLKLNPRPTREKANKAVDALFISMASAYESSSAAVILSGMGIDGTAGMSAVREQGGLTIAQDNSAGFTAMPGHAIDANIIDFVLPPEQIGKKLTDYFAMLRKGWSDREPISKSVDEESTYRKIMELMHQRKAADFSLYKQTTVRRRIVRRMLMLKIVDISAYLKYITEHITEQDLLFYDLLISVTSFFRDPYCFELLIKKIVPLMLDGKNNGEPIRIWVAGCSTGQEPYSIAIALHEFFGQQLHQQRIHIFATDISDKSIKIARSGVYQKKDLEGVSVGRLAKYFEKDKGHYVVSKTIRDMCVFAVHNFLKDPPFAKMDLITCRNVMIYFKPFLQKKAIAIFHYALRDKGILWLGNSETVGSASEFFNPLQRKSKFYTRKPGVGRYITIMGESKETIFEEENMSLHRKEVKTENYQKSADEIVLAKHAPAGVIVNDQFDIVQFRGITSRFLEPPSGKATFNLMKMAKEGLSFELRNALHRAQSSSEPFSKSGVSINGGEIMVGIEVIPMLNTFDPYYLVLFKEEPTMPMRRKVSAKTIKTAEQERILQLERELTQIREDMRSITEAQEIAKEELQSSNEELLSGSEELQSLNEELETSKEELQSTNEELLTVNQELFESNEELNISRKLAEATIAVLHEPLIMLNSDLMIQSANNAFCKIFRISQEQAVGKSFYQLQNGRWNIPGLAKEFARILQNNEKIIEKEISFTFPTLGERVVKFNIQPVKKANGEQLILLAMDDITERKNDILEQKVFSEELQKQIAEKVKLERQKNDFISMASHELKTPVTSIKGYTQALHRRFQKEGNKEAEDFLAKMDNQINKLTSLIGDLLDATKVTAGQLEYNIDLFDFNDLVKEVTEEMQQTSRKHQMKLSLDTSVTLRGDRNRIGQVITNLLSNAIKYSPKADQVVVSTSLENNKINLSVKDFGIGISEENQKSVFEQFFRASGFLQNTFSGLGLGLFISSKIIIRHHGDLRVSSAEGEGSIFTISLPVENEK